MDLELISITEMHREVAKGSADRNSKITDWDCLNVSKAYTNYIIGPGAYFKYKHTRERQRLLA